jgi:hypothetical protein
MSNLLAGSFPKICLELEKLLKSRGDTFISKECKPLQNLAVNSPVGIYKCPGVPEEE